MLSMYIILKLVNLADFDAKHRHRCGARLQGSMPVTLRTNRFIRSQDHADFASRRTSSSEVGGHRTSGILRPLYRMRTYTVDLPLGIVSQAIFLSAVMGPDAIWMAGDDHNLQKGVFDCCRRTFLTA